MLIEANSLHCSFTRWRDEALFGGLLEDSVDSFVVGKKILILFKMLNFHRAGTV